MGETEIVKKYYWNLKELDLTKLKNLVELGKNGSPPFAIHSSRPEINPRGSFQVLILC